MSVAQELADQCWSDWETSGLIWSDWLTGLISSSSLIGPPWSIQLCKASLLTCLSCWHSSRKWLYLVHVWFQNRNAAHLEQTTCNAYPPPSVM